MALNAASTTNYADKRI